MNAAVRRAAVSCAAALALGMAGPALAATWTYVNDGMRLTLAAVEVPVRYSIDFTRLVRSNGSLVSAWIRADLPDGVELPIPMSTPTSTYTHDQTLYTVNCRRRELAPERVHFYDRGHRKVAGLHPTGAPRFFTPWPGRPAEVWIHAVCGALGVPLGPVPSLADRARTAVPRPEG